MPIGFHEPREIGLTVNESARGRSLASWTRPQLRYYLHVPERRSATDRVMVLVHGVSRNAEEQVELFQRFADRYGVLLLAPVFDRETFTDYQRLGRKGAGQRADLALIRVLNEVGTRTGWDTGRVDLFGFSGGAQFAHRFAFVHASRVRNVVLGAAGWYTMPDDSIPYPYGLGDVSGLEPSRLNATAAARLPMLVTVGEHDDRVDDENLNRSRIIDLTQGLHRLERAQRWVLAMNAYARSKNLERRVDIDVLPGIGHSFRQAVVQGGLAERAFAHCYGAIEPDQRGGANARIEGLGTAAHSRKPQGWCQQ